ncbi:MAG: hypothetical protein CMB56_005445 [Methanobacteriota archaeon]|nr:MAG: hypothetical protein CMB56_005445 [Euryarchaeota archaeon]|tara:strand:- start:3740 stop:3973 length:234 start_codon:yes stop_codon:yes gene_type:complete
MNQMGISDLTAFEAKLYKWLCKSDFENVPWSTPKAAKAFKVKQDEIYEALAELTKKIPNHIQIYYDNDSIRISADEQ